MPGMIYSPGGVRCFQNKCTVNHETGAKLFDIYIPGLSSNPHRAGNRNRIGQRLAGLKSDSFFMKDRLTEAQVKRKDGSKVEEKKQSFQEESVILLSFIVQ